MCLCARAPPSRVRDEGGDDRQRVSSCRLQLHAALGDEMSPCRHVACRWVGGRCAALAKSRARDAPPDDRGSESGQWRTTRCACSCIMLFDVRCSSLLRGDAGRRRRERAGPTPKRKHAATFAVATRHAATPHESQTPQPTRTTGHATRAALRHTARRADSACASRTRDTCHVPESRVTARIHGVRSPRPPAGAAPRGARARSVTVILDTLTKHHPPPTQPTPSGDARPKLNAIAAARGSRALSVMSVFRLGAGAPAPPLQSL